MAWCSMGTGHGCLAHHDGSGVAALKRLLKKTHILFLFTIRAFCGFGFTPADFFSVSSASMLSAIRPDLSVSCTMPRPGAPPSGEYPRASPFTWAVCQHVFQAAAPVSYQLRGRSRRGAASTSGRGRSTHALCLELRDVQIAQHRQDAPMPNLLPAAALHVGREGRIPRATCCGCRLDQHVALHSRNPSGSRSKSLSTGHHVAVRAPAVDSTMSLRLFGKLPRCSRSLSPGPFVLSMTFTPFIRRVNGCADGSFGHPLRRATSPRGYCRTPPQGQSQPCFLIDRMQASGQFGVLKVE